MDPIEIVAVLLGLINVTLVVRRSMWNYPFGLAMVALYFWIFLGAKLYSDALLQIFFFVVQLYGWLNWSRSRAEAGEVRVLLLSSTAWFGALAVCAAASGLWGLLMHSITDAHYPWWDGSVAMISIVAQLLQSRRYLQSWYLWIAADVIAIPLFALKGLWITAGLYGVFLILCLFGLAEWRRASSAGARPRASQVPG
ncbi:MAG: nicotinamide riboside transporter PnuC [Sphingomonas sp.]